MADKPEKDTDTFLAIYEGGNGQIELRFDGDRETIWATQAQMAELFKVDRSGITKHINDIFESGELEELSNVQKMHISSTKPTNTYTLDVILSVGYRVNSAIATKFRRWATKTLSEYIRDGAIVDERRLAENPALARRLASKIRRIRTSEINLYTKVRNVFKQSSSNYDAGSQTATTFFAMAQDKFHYAITKLNALLAVNDYPVLYEYKASLRGKADAHVQKVHNEYMGQLQAPKKNKELPPGEGNDS